jgi:TonB-dependent SusC/RagA subfamily outer membrane receptor
VQLLSQSSPGIRTPGVQGMVGAGGTIRIRGVSSMALGNQPLLYVDGVRVDNESSTGPNIRGGRMVSRLNDINPEDIESIEIIKGPAAATLYGTEASNGVVQIITKRGAAGAPTMDFSLRQGINYMDSPGKRFFKTYWLRRATDPEFPNRLDSMNIYNDRERAGNPIFTNGHLQQFNGSIRGGSDLLNYYVSAGFDDEVGIVDYNTHEQFTTRANIAITPPGGTWSFETSLGYTRNETRFAQAFSRFGIWEATIWAKPDTRDTPFEGFRYLTPEAAAHVDSRSKVNRFLSSFKVTHNPVSWLAQRLVVGVDYSSEANQILFPRLTEQQELDWPFFGARAVGEKTLENGHTTYTSFDYGITGSFDVTPEITSATSIGVQFNKRERRLGTQVGNTFPTPSVTTIGGAGTTRGNETFEENKSLGTYVQQQFGWRERVFVTAALRGDDNSAFGADFDAAYYPKLSGTWVTSEEDFWSLDVVEQFRVRAAWGKAGAQPGVFDAITLYNPTAGPGGSVAITPRSLGDPGLSPEVSAELELGFDASFLDGRLGLEATYFSKRTTDALVLSPIRPSAGFLGTQLVNLGEVKAWGTELGINAQILNGDWVGFDIGVNHATHKNQVIDIGGTNIAPGRGERDVPGYPISSYFGQLPVVAEFLPGTSTVNGATLMCDGGTGPGGKSPGGAAVSCDDAPQVFVGQPEPTWSGAVTLGLTIRRNLRLTMVTEYQGGDDWTRSDNIAGAHRSMVNTLPMNPIIDPFFGAQQTLLDNAQPGQFNPGFARIREISALYNLPQSLVGKTGASRASISLAARNVGFLWRKQEVVDFTKIFDPEMNAPGDAVSVANATRIPPISQIVATMRISF